MVRLEKSNEILEKRLKQVGDETDTDGKVSMSLYQCSVCICVCICVCMCVRAYVCVGLKICAYQGLRNTCLRNNIQCLIFFTFSNKRFV